LSPRKTGSQKKEKSFEEALSRLEQIVLELEEGELSLEDALQKFEEGIKLSEFCMQKLTQAEGKVKKLIKTSKGEFKTEDLETPEEQ
jgi:exodeoxyribonuclease VII small subunit